MKRQAIIEVIFVIVFIILGFLLVNPFEIWMPGKLEMTVLFLLVLAFSSYAIFFWREQAHDEREEYLRMTTARFSWLVGSSVIIAGLLIQGLKHAIDPWLVYALVGMMLSKALALVYIKSKNK